MIPAFIVLAVVACGLGGYIAYAEVRDKKKGAREHAPVTAEILQAIEEETSESEAVESDDVADEIVVAESKSIGTDDEAAATEHAAPQKIVVRYGKSFLARLIQSDDETKRYYSVLKNRLLSFGGVKSRITYKCETFRKGRKTLAKLRLRGKTLWLCLALNAESYADSKYKVENLANVRSYAATPCVYRIRNDRRLAYAHELLENLAADNGLAESVTEQTDYAAQYPYEPTDALIARKLIKVYADKNA